MARLLINTVGAMATALIRLIGLSWELRAFTAVPVLSLTLFVTGLFYVSQYEPSAAASAPAISLVSWGERDVTMTDTPSSDAHIVYATVRLTAGDLPVQIPDINHPDPQNQLWLTIDDTTRRSDNGHLTTDSHGDTYQWLASHHARLMPAGGTEPYSVPSSACSAMGPGQTCSITVAWDLPHHGPVGHIHSLVLDTTTPEGHHRQNEFTWPNITPESTCTGDIAPFCGDTTTSP